MSKADLRESGFPPREKSMTERNPVSAPVPERLAAEQQSPRRAREQALRDIVTFLVKLGVIALAVWVLAGVVFGVAVQSGEDMYPRIRDGDLMVYYRLQREYHIGDVVTFTRDGVRYTGRIVAQGGDTVDISEEGELLVNGSVQDEEIFYPTEALEGGISLPCEVPEQSFFLLCDFRTNGTDSRSYGPVAKDALDGKVITILRRRGI